MNIKTILSAILIAYCAQSQAQKINFKWEKDSIGDRLIDKIAMSVPVTIENKTYAFQFDLGANATLIYDQCFSEAAFIKSKKVDPTSDAGGHTIFTIDDQSFNIGDYPIKNHKLYGLLNHDQGESCGTVGADVFQEKCLIIDFPKQSITVVNEVDKGIERKTVFVPMNIVNNKAIIPLKIDGKTYNFLYDSGSSIFPIVSYRENFDRLITNAKAKDELNIRNFNNPLIVKSVETNTAVQIGDNTFGVKEFWYTEDDFFSFKQDNIDGIVGNVFFMDKTIVIDFKNKRFGIRK